MDPDADEPAYDRFAAAYRRWWAPVIAPAALRLLDRLQPLVAREATLQLLDVGVGTGTLALGALERWPRASVVGVDPSRRMMDYAAEAAARRGASFSSRLELLRGGAMALPLGDRSVDAAVSSFVIQLVPSRAGMLRELFRVVRPGGRVGVITWQVDDEPFAPDDVVWETFDELGIDTAEGGGDRCPYPSPRAAAAEFRRAGFRQVRSTLEWLDHRYTAETYLGVLEHWGEDDAFTALSSGRRDRLRAALLDRLSRLSADELRWRRPLVSVLAVRP
jgi:SAM-dependent methyltransferase